MLSTNYTYQSGRFFTCQAGHCSSSRPADLRAVLQAKKDFPLGGPWVGVAGAVERGAGSSGLATAALRVSPTAISSAGPGSLAQAAPNRFGRRTGSARPGRAGRARARPAGARWPNKAQQGRRLFARPPATIKWIGMMSRGSWRPLWRRAHQRRCRATSRRRSLIWSRAGALYCRSRALSPAQPSGDTRSAYSRPGRPLDAPQVPYKRERV